MKNIADNLDWPSLIALEPSAGLIPSALGAVAKQVNAKAGTTLFRIGDPVRHVHLVIQGEARLIRLGRRGETIISAMNPVNRLMTLPAIIMSRQ